MPSCQNCGRSITDAEYNTPPAGYCRVCRRNLQATAEARRTMPQPCRRCGRAIPPEEYNRNNGYCDTCALQEQLATPLSGVTVRCPHCNDTVDLSRPDIQGNMTQGYRCPNPKCHYRIKPMKCPQCNAQNRVTWIDSNSTGCNVCDWTNSSYTKTSKSLHEITGKKLNTAKIYEILIYEIAGIFVTFGLPFFGLPSLPLLGVVLMAIFPFYSFLPNEHDALASRQQNVESLGGWAAGALLLRGIVKMFAFILTVMQFMMIPVSKLIPLAISFIYYFSLPVSYKVTQPFKMIEAWFRIGVGMLIAFFIYMAFAGTYQAISLALMSIAFFCTSFPRHKEAPEETGVVRLEIPKLAGVSSNQAEMFLKIIFSLFMIPALIFSGVGIGTSSLQIIFEAVWLLSFFGGWTAGSEGRPALGILMIGITLFVFTFTATGVMGQAIFGYWWPQVESTGEAVFGPLGNLWIKFRVECPTLGFW